ncbi:MAG TPA: ectonucleotide pyrophosphatase/phosphodiesterase [Tepidisphaeraceae bacterium]|jgi:predicted AlkP superfamily pyrophosphatase or phosphodiesterase
MALIFALFVACLAERAAAAMPTTRPIAAIQRVMIISVDGLRPDLLYFADTPNLHQLCRRGSFTLWAKTTPASVTLPSHVSMLTGVSPEGHAIMWNGDLPLKEPVYPAVPTIFDLAHHAGYTTAMVAGKRKFSVLDVPGSLDWKWIAAGATSEDGDVNHAAEAIIRSHQPQLMMVHFPSVDNVGHAHDWGSDEQLAAISQVDRYIGQLIALLAELKLEDQTLVIITADHGGAGRTHGADDPRSRTIPWIVAGPGVRQNFDLTRLGREYNVEIYDTFATTAAVLGIPVSGHIDGKFISAAFENQELLISTYRPSMQPATQPAE